MKVTSLSLLLFCLLLNCGAISSDTLKVDKEAPGKLVDLMEKLASQETNLLLKRHFESIAIFTQDTSHGFEITEQNMEDASRVLEFFQGEGSKWETYLDGPRPLMMSFKSPTDGKYSFYNLFLPKGFDERKKDVPFYMELHGSGGGKNDNPRNFIYKALQPEIKGVSSMGYRKEGFLVYPWGRGDQGYRGIAETDIFEVLEDFDNMFETDPLRQYIYGFSMGGGGTFKFAQLTMDRWTAVASYSGAIFNPTMEEAKAFIETPVWMVWGEQEEKLGKGNKKLKELFIEAGVDLTWEEIKGVGHSYQGSYQGQMLDWLKSKVKE